MRSSLLTVSLLLWSCDRPPAEPPPAQAANPPLSGAPVLEVVPVVEQKLDATVRLPGELSPYEMVAIYPRASGFLEAIHVDRGSRVQRGQLLARLSAPELVAQRAEAESKAIATQSTFDRLKAAASTPGAVAKHDLELAEAALRSDEARVKSLRAMEGYLDVRAPFDGVVTERNMHPGALLGPPTGAAAVPMLRVEQIKRLRLTIAVPETDVGAIAEGAQAWFTVRAWPGQKIPATVRRISHSVESKTRTMPVELDVDNGAGKLAPACTPTSSGRSGAAACRSSCPRPPSSRPPSGPTWIGSERGRWSR